MKRVLFFRRPTLRTLLLLDQFVTDRAEGAVDGTAPEPGAGPPRHIVDGGGGAFSIGSGHLNFTAQTDSPAIGKMYADHGPQTRKCGLMFQVDYSGGTNTMIGFSNAMPVTPSSINGIQLYSTNPYIFTINNIISPKTAGSTYHLITRTTSYYILTSTGGTGYKLWWMDRDTTKNASTYYPAVAPYNTVGYVDNWTVKQLGAPWNTDWGACITHQDFPIAGNSQTSEADGTVECDWYPLAGEIFELTTRMTDLSNRYIVRCDHSGGANNNTIKLLVQNAGSETELQSAAVTWTTGIRMRIAIIQEGTMMKVSAQTYNSAPHVYFTHTVTDSFNLTATGTMVSGAVIMYNFSSYPRTFTDLTTLPTPGISPAPHTMVLTKPTASETFQRSGTTADIAIHGTFNETGTHDVEASFNGGDYATIASSIPSGTPFTGVLASQAQGQGTLIVRVKDVTATTMSVPDVLIGEVFMATGQSNSEGHGTNNQVYSGTPKAAKFGRDYRWQPLVDPICSNLDCVDNIYSLSPGAGSIWPLVATAIANQIGCPVAFVPSAKGSTLIEDWAPGANHFDRATLYGCAAYRGIQVNGLRALLWIQGETASNTQVDYKTRLQAIANAFYADLGIKLMPAKLFIVDGGDNARQQRIRAAVGDAWAEGGNILTGPDLSGLSAEDAELGYYHLKSDGNLASAATLCANRLIAEFGW